MIPPPTGTVTFLFTDIEGSTRLWEAHPLAMGEALVQHDALLRTCIQACQGYVFKTVGDAFCVAFDTATQALDAALQSQLALQSQDWGETSPLRVRMALHTGEAQERDNDYFGPALNRTARLEALAYGGQILLSQAAYELVRDLVPSRIELIAMGTHRLKDLHRAEPVYQAVCPGLPTKFPPPRSLGSFPNNLPLQLSRFIGREREIAALCDLLMSHPLVTLIGTGGTGKSRLSLQVAAEVIDRYADGVWLVELAPLSDPGLVAYAIAGALGRNEEASGEANLVEYLKPRHLLLILDNCEHLVGACAQLVQKLLGVCPHISVLASSREGLNLVGEQAYPVPPLPLPDPTSPFTVQTLPQYEAVQLFLDRAANFQPTFGVTSQNASALGQLCCRLDGIPLAIELAAVKIKSMSVEQIEVRLKDRFKLLVGGSRTALPRQQTLRALIDWSYDLLNDREKLLLQRLSVFVGGWTLEAAEVVCVGEGLDAWEVLEWLTALVDKSLVVFEEREGCVRYRLLETIQDYARAKREESGQERNLATRHADFYLAMAEETRGQMQGPEQAAALDMLEQDYPNFRTALDYCCAEDVCTERGLRIGTALWSFYQFRGYLADGRRYLNTLLAQSEVSGPSESRATALQIAGNMAFCQGDLGQAELLHQESLALQQEQGYQNGMAHTLSSLALVVGAQGEYPRSRQLFEQSLALYRQSHDRPGIARTLGNLGMIAQHAGELDTAIGLHTESLGLWRVLGHEQSAAIELGNLGCVARKQGDLAQARAYFVQCLSSCLLHKEMFITPYVLEELAAILFAEERLEKSACLYGAAAGLREKAGTPLPAIEQAEIDTVLPQLCARLCEASFGSTYQKGQHLSQPEAIAYAIRAATQSPECGDV